MLDKSLSIIIIDNGNLEKCIESINNQSYIKNIETIIVKDFKEIYTNIDSITGDFVTILYSKDTISVDYYRAMIIQAEKKNADIIMSNSIIKYKDGGKAYINLIESSLTETDEERILEAYLNQEGLSFLWSIYGNKIFSNNLFNITIKEIENKSEKSKNIEDFYFFTIMFYNAKKVSYIENDYLFYSMDNNLNNKENLEKYIENVAENFELMKNFLISKNLYEKNETNIDRWKSIYFNYCNNIAKENNIDIQIERKLGTVIEAVKEDTIYKIKTAWNDKLENIKKEIMNEETKVVSFDIFDTLILRPFWNPTDLFIFLDEYFRKINNTDIGIDFSKIRIKAEERKRKTISIEENNIQEITLEDIYEEIREETKIEHEIIDKMMEKEKQLEIEFCTERKTGKELYELSILLGKKVICISDMYLSKDVIKAILEKNGYNQIQKIYLSSDIKLTKFTGDLYKNALKDLNILPNKVVHIGDNHFSDYENSIKNNIRGQFLAKPIDMFCNENITNNLSKIFKRNLPNWQDNTNGLNFLGIRCMLAIVANRYFDNPYKTFNNETDFNADPNLIGYYALGMYLFGIAKWLLDDTMKKKYEKIVFMARDGYWIMKAYEILKELYPSAPKEEYVYISRRALIPVTLRDRFDFYKLTELIDIYKYTPKTILKYFDNILINTENLEKECESNNIDINKKFKSQNEFNNYINMILDKFYDKEKHTNDVNALKKYFSKIFSGNSCTFDIGYSAKPEMYLSKLCERPINTYFINISNEEALKHSQIGKFDLNVYFNYKPTITGVIRESLMSISDPSCIAYKIESNEEVTPIFDQNTKMYQERFIFDTMQRNAIEFIKDILKTFGKNIDLLYYQNYYISLPHEMYIQSPSKLDQEILNGMNFEDTVGLGTKIPAIEEWNREIESNNQQSGCELFGISENIKERIELKSQIKELENQINEFKIEKEELDEQIQKKENELQGIYNSKRWKYAEKISKFIKKS